MSEGSAGAQDRGADLTGLTMRYAEHLAALRYADIPADVIHKAKTIIRDGVGNQIAASAISEPASRMVELVRGWGGAPQATSPATALKVPAPMAVLCNAMLGHGVELDDAHGTGLIKGGSVLVSLALASAELGGCSGEE